MVRVTGLSFAAVLLACGPAVDVGDSGAEGDDSSDGDTGTTSSPGTTASTTVSTTDSTSTTTGTPQVCAGDDFVSGCQSYCAAVVTCNPDNGPYEDCVNGCIAELTPYTVDCQNAFCGAYACVGTLDCPTLEQGIGDCADLFSSASDRCGASDEVTDDDDGGDTDCFVGSGGGESCSWGCDVDGVQRRFDCSNGTCTCFENEVEIASCGDGGICAILDAIEDYADGCCGW